MSHQPRAREGTPGRLRISDHELPAVEERAVQVSVVSGSQVTRGFVSTTVDRLETRLGDVTDPLLSDRTPRVKGAAGRWIELREGLLEPFGRVRAGFEECPIRTVVTMFAIPALISVLAFVSAVAFWMDRSVAGEEAFLDHAAEVLAMDSSQEAIAVRLMDEAVDAVPLLALIRGAGERATLVLLGSGAFDGVFDRLIVEGHRHVVSQTDEPFTADLTDVRTVLVAPIAQIAPDLAELVPVDAFEAVVILDSDALPVVGRVAGWLPAISVFTAAVGVFLAVTLVMLSRRRSTALVTVGLAVLIAGIGVYAWSTFGGSIATARIADGLTRVLVTNGYAVFTRSLRTEGLALLVAGMALTATGALAALVGSARVK